MKRILLFFVFLPLISSAQMIKTVAGNGIFGYIGDGVAATAAEIMNPTSIAVDKNGNFYFGDNSLTDIRMVNTSGIISRIAGVGVGGYTGDGGPATQAQLNGISAIVIDDSGALYVADANNNVIRKINSSGTISTVAGNGYGAGGLYGGFTGDGGPATAASMFDPMGVAIDRYRNLYISDTRNYRIRKVDTNGVITTIAGNGISIYSGDGGQATAASLIFPTCIALDTAGNVYFQDYNHIRKITPSGNINTVVGYGPAGYSGDGYLGFTAQFNGPAGLVIDSAGNMYIADTHNARIRKVDAVTGIVNTIAGTGFPGYNGDGGPAAAARLNSPSGIALDKYGNLYIADALNNRVRKMNGGVSLHTPIVSTMTASLYPNPAANDLTVTCTDKISSAVIYDLSGHVVAAAMQGVPFPYVYQAAQEVHLNVSGLPAGVYLVRINGCVERKFLKE